MVQLLSGQPNELSRTTHSLSLIGQKVQPSDLLPSGLWAPRAQLHNQIPAQPQVQTTNLTNTLHSLTSLRA